METLYTLTELEASLQISRRTLQKYIKEGRLQAIKMGKWRVPESAVQAFLHTDAQHPPAAASE